MSTTVYALANGKTSLNTLSASELNAISNAVELGLVTLAELVGAGVFGATDFNASVIGGSLAVSVSAGRAIVGASGSRIFIYSSGAVVVSGLAASTTNYVYLLSDGTFTSNTTGTPPANGILVSTNITSGTEATSVNNAPTGRVTFGAAANRDATQTLLNKTLTSPVLTTPTLTAPLLGAELTPAQITSNQDDYNPTGLSTAGVLRLSTDASRNLTGIQGGAAGRLLMVHNVGGFNLVLKNNTTSTAANRFLRGTGDLTLGPDESVLLEYDGTSSRWRSMR